MSLVRNYILRNYGQERIVQLYASFEYAANHPYTRMNKKASDASNSRYAL